MKVLRRPTVLSSWALTPKSTVSKEHLLMLHYNMIHVHLCIHTTQNITTTIATASGFCLMGSNLHRILAHT